MKTIDTLSRGEVEDLCVDFVHRLHVHDAMWQRQVEKRLGSERMCRVLSEVRPRSHEVQVSRLAKIVGEEEARRSEHGSGILEWSNLLPARLGDLSEGKLRELMAGIAVNWLAQDGVWFQAVEFSDGMALAKECNDACWADFSPFEAWMIRKLIGLGPRPGLAGLKAALGMRLYAAVNRQSIHDEGPDAFVFRMDDCRVQAARRRKGLDDYPCRSGGLVEYTTFASAIDDRIRTECVACPPDEHPGEWFCAWRFAI